MCLHRGVCLYVYTRTHTHVFNLCRVWAYVYVNVYSHLIVFVCYFWFWELYAQFKDKQLLVVPPALNIFPVSPIVYFWIMLELSLVFVYIEKKASTLCQHDSWWAYNAGFRPLSLALSPSTAVNPLGTSKQFCMCVCIYVRVSHFGALRSSSSASPLCLRCFADLARKKSLSQALIISCISHADA